MGFELADRLVQGVVLDLADAAERVGDLGQVAVGVVLVGGDGRCAEAGIDGFGLIQGDGAGGGAAGAGAEPALEGGAGCGACRQGDLAVAWKVGATGGSAVDACR